MSSVNRKIDELDPLNVEARYPANKDAIDSMMTPEFSAILLEKSSEMQKWIKMKLSEKRDNI